MVTEQINALLGEADAPDRWHYRSLQLLTAGEAIIGLQLAHHPVCADPQASSGWRCDEPVVTTFEGIARLPACWYTSDGSAFGEGDLPHLGLAHQSLNHFSCKSEYEELLSRTALPVGVRKGMVDAMGNSQAGPVVLGPNTCMDLPSDASFEFVEIRARSRAEHRAWLQILDDTMRRDASTPIPEPRRRPHRDGDQPHRLPELRAAAGNGDPEGLAVLDPPAALVRPDR